jgi:eukaryotic-like serine/threonine-protein kinase
MTLQTGDIIDGKYRIVRLLGEGGMGSVYEGENARIHRKVAIKVLHAAVAAKADVVQRFEREAQAAGRIGSEHIVEVLDLGNLPGGERFMVMEYLDGENLGDRIKHRKRLHPREVGPMAHQLLEGLAAAHQAGIIHRDLKPDNVYLINARNGQRDFVKVLDFGVSKFSALDSEMSMTRTGAVMGTPFYMSPEQARGGKIDFRSDLYSVGVVMYQAVTGRVPFHAETFNELVFKIALEAPEPVELLTPGLDPGFAAIVARAMARDPGVRFQTAREFQAAIGQWLMTSPEAAMPMGPGMGPGQDPRLSSGGGHGYQQAMTPGGGMQPGGFAQGGPQFAQSGPQFAQSGPQFAQSAPQFSQSGPQFGQPLPQFSQSGPQFAQGGQLGQSGPQLGASQGGLTVTGRQPRGSGAMIAIGLVGTLVVAGGAFGAYKLFGPKPPAKTATSIATAQATGAPAASVAAAPVSAAPASTPAPATATATAAADTAATTTPSAAPAPADTSTAVAAPHLTGKLPPAPPAAGTAAAKGGHAAATATAAPTAPAKSNSGRTIQSEL